MHPAYIDRLSTAGLDAGDIAQNWATSVIRDEVSLAEHHIYGSSHLGIQYYDAALGQLTSGIKNVIDYSNPTQNVFSLNSRKPWYSESYGDNVIYTSRTPWNNWDRQDNTFTFRVLGMRQYELTDHLGNVLATVLDRKTGHLPAGATSYDYWQADVASAMDYYPFGMPMPGRVSNGDKYRFGFNGQEKDNEVTGIGNHLDFNFRGYDSRLGRFWSVDPLAPKYPWNSPYAFAENRVIDGRDLEGLEFSPASATAGGGRSSTAVMMIINPAKIDEMKANQRAAAMKLPPPSVIRQDYSHTIWGSAGGKAYAEAMVQREAAFVPGATVGIKALKHETITKTDVALEAISLIPFGKLGGLVGRGFGEAFNLIRTETISGNQAARAVGDIMQRMKAGEVMEPIRVFEQEGKQYVIDGHHRLEAATRLGQKIEYQTVAAEELSQYGYKDASEVVQAASEAGASRVKLNNKIVNKAASASGQ